jgi:hypothetical protein
MRKHISFAIAATVLGLAMVFWLASMVETNPDVARPRADLLSPMSRHFLNFVAACDRERGQCADGARGAWDLGQPSPGNQPDLLIGAARKQ